MARRTASKSLMLPLMKEILLRISARFSSLPAERSSSTTTLSPRRTSSSTVLEPIKPAPPVTTYLIQTILCLLKASQYFRKTCENAFGTLTPQGLQLQTLKPGKSAPRKTGSRDNVVYDEKQAPKIFNRAHV